MPGVDDNGRPVGGKGYRIAPRTKSKPKPKPKPKRPAYANPPAPKPAAPKYKPGGGDTVSGGPRQIERANKYKTKRTPPHSRASHDAPMTKKETQAVNRHKASKSYSDALAEGRESRKRADARRAAAKKKDAPKAKLRELEARSHSRAAGMMSLLNGKTASEVGETVAAGAHAFYNRPGHVASTTGTDVWRGVKGAVPGAIDAVLHPKKTGDAIGKDYKRRYSGSYWDKVHRMEKEGVASEVGDVAGFVLPGVGQSFGRVMAAGRVGSRAARHMTAPRPGLRTSGGTVKGQKVSKNVFTATAQRGQDKVRDAALQRRMSAQARHDAKSRAAGRSAHGQEVVDAVTAQRNEAAGRTVEVRPATGYARGKAQRRAEAQRKSRAVRKNKAETGHAAGSARKQHLRQLNRKERRAYRYAWELGWNGGDATRADIQKRISDIQAEREKRGRTIEGRERNTDNLTDLQSFLADVDGHFTPNLRAYIEGERQRSYRIGREDPSTKTKQRLLRRYGPAALHHEVERKRTAEAEVKGVETREERAARVKRANELHRMGKEYRDLQTDRARIDAQRQQHLADKAAHRDLQRGIGKQISDLNDERIRLVDRQRFLNEELEKLEQDYGWNPDGMPEHAANKQQVLEDALEETKADLDRVSADYQDARTARDNGLLSREQADAEADLALSSFDGDARMKKLDARLAELVEELRDFGDMDDLADELSPYLRQIEELDARHAESQSARAESDVDPDAIEDDYDIPEGDDLDATLDAILGEDGPEGGPEEDDLLTEDALPEEVFGDEDERAYDERRANLEVALARRQRAGAGDTELSRKLHALVDAEEAAAAAQRRVETANSTSDAHWLAGVSHDEGAAIARREADAAHGALLRAKVDVLDHLTQMAREAKPGTVTRTIDKRESDAAYVRRIQQEMGDRARPLYAPSKRYALDDEMEFSPYAVGGTTAVKADHAWTGENFRLGLQDSSPETVFTGYAQNIKRKNNWQLVADTLVANSLPDIGGPRATLSQVKRQLAQSNYNTRTFVLWNPRIYAEEARVDGNPAFEALEKAKIDPASTALATHLEKTTGWVAIPSAAYKEMVAQSRGGGKLGRGYDQVKGKSSRYLLTAGNLPWLEWQIAGNASLGTLGALTRGTILPLDMVNMTRFYRGLSDKEKAQFDSWLSVSSAHDQAAPRMGAAFDSAGAMRRFADGYMGYKQHKAFTTNVLGKGRGPEVRQVLNPNEWFMSADQAQNNAFQRTLLYNAVKRDAVQRMTRNADAVEKLTGRIVQIFGKGPEDAMKGILRNRTLMEDNADHVAEWLGDYVTFTSAERTYLKRFTMFYGFLRFSTKLALYTMPVKHPVTTGILMELGQLHEDEVEDIFGPEFTAALTKMYGPLGEDGNPSWELDVAKMHPAINQFFGIQRPTQLVGAVVPPVLAALIDQGLGTALFKDSRWAVEGKAANQYRNFDEFGPGLRGRILADDLASTLYPYRLGEKLTQDGPQGDDSMLFSERETKYSNRDQSGKRRNANIRREKQFLHSEPVWKRALHEAFPLLPEASNDTTEARDRAALRKLQEKRENGTTKRRTRSGGSGLGSNGLGTNGLSSGGGKAF